MVAAGGSPTELADRVSELLTDVLGLEKCHFHFGTGMGNPRLQHDGTLTWGETLWDVDNEGLPSNQETELLVSAGGRFWGRFLMTPAPGSRPTLTQRLGRGVAGGPGRRCLDRLPPGPRPALVAREPYERACR